MDLAAYAWLVMKMRAAQKQYFRSRHPDDLVASKQLERRVDLVTQELLSKQQQMGFEEGAASNEPSNAS